MHVSNFGIATAENQFGSGMRPEMFALLMPVKTKLRLYPTPTLRTTTPTTKTPTVTPNNRNTDSTSSLSGPTDQ